MELDYDKDVTIDPESLDVEWLDQPRLMMRYSKAAASAGRDMDLAKEELDVVRADLDKEIRKDPDAFNLPKVTETAITGAIQTHQRYREAFSAYVEAKYEFEMVKSAVRAIDTKKSALENLVKLHGQQYFAGPRAPRDLTAEWEERENQKRADQKVTMRRRKR